MTAGPVTEQPGHPLLFRMQRVKARAAGRPHLGCSGKPSKSHLRCDPAGRSEASRAAGRPGALSAPPAVLPSPVVM